MLKREGSQQTAHSDEFEESVVQQPTSPHQRPRVSRHRTALPPPQPPVHDGLTDDEDRDKGPNQPLGSLKKYTPPTRTKKPSITREDEKNQTVKDGQVLRGCGGNVDWTSIRTALVGIKLEAPPRHWMLRADGTVVHRHATDSLSRSRYLPFFAGPFTKLHPNKIVWGKKLVPEKGPMWLCLSSATGHNECIVICSWAYETCPLCKNGRHRGNSMVLDFAWFKEEKIYFTVQWPDEWKATHGKGGVKKSTHVGRKKSARPATSSSPATFQSSAPVEVNDDDDDDMDDYLPTKLVKNEDPTSPSNSFNASHSFMGHQRSISPDSTDTAHRHRPSSHRSRLFGERLRQQSPPPLGGPLDAFLNKTYGDDGGVSLPRRRPDEWSQYSNDEPSDMVVDQPEDLEEDDEPDLLRDTDDEPDVLEDMNENMEDKEDDEPEVQDENDDL